LQFALIKAPKNGKIKTEHFPHSTRNVSPSATGNPQDIVPRKRKLTESSVREALVKSKGNKLQAAKILGIGRATLYRFLDSL
jgi:transcriptional regulator of acetoin/glycerol metabolism